MKKTYINPSIEVVKINCNPLMLTVSLTGEEATTNGDGEYNDARYFDFDDEDEY